MENLNAGDKAVLWVEGDHYITVILNNSFNDYMSGSITFEEYKKVCDDIADSIAKNSAHIIERIVILNDKKTASGLKTSDSQIEKIAANISNIVKYPAMQTAEVSDTFKMNLIFNKGEEISAENIAQDVMDLMKKLFTDEELENAVFIKSTDGNKTYYFVVKNQTVNESGAVVLGIAMSKDNTIKYEDGSSAVIVTKQYDGDTHFPQYLNSLQALEYLTSAIINACNKNYSDSETAEQIKAAFSEELANYLSQATRGCTAVVNEYRDILQAMTLLDPESQKYRQLEQKKYEFEKFLSSVTAIISNAGKSMYSDGAKNIIERILKRLSGEDQDNIFEKFFEKFFDLLYSKTKTSFKLGFPLLRQ
jgi:hypothetical protein